MSTPAHILRDRKIDREIETTLRYLARMEARGREIPEARLDMRPFGGRLGRDRPYRAEPAVPVAYCVAPHYPPRPYLDVRVYRGEHHL